MAGSDKVNILLVDDQPAKLLSYETILDPLGEHLIKATSARDALEQLLKHEIAVILIDICMPELDGFQLAALIREHPRFRQTAIIFISAIHLTDLDRLRAYEMGAVDYVPVPVIAEVLRAKVRIFAELYRKTRQLEQLNRELERRVAERTAELEASSARLLQSEQRRSLALAAGQMGSWEWDPINGHFTWDDGQYRIFGVNPESFELTIDNIRKLIHPEDWKNLQDAIKPPAASGTPSFQTEFRVCRPNGELRWCIGTAVATVDATDHIIRINGVTVDITERKEAEEHQGLLAREVDHRARNALALVQSIVRLTRADSIKSYIGAVDGRIGALSRAHTLLAQSRWQGADLARLIDEELAPYRMTERERISAAGPNTSLESRTAQTLALALHELSTNAAKYGALSVIAGRVDLVWELQRNQLILRWSESGGPAVQPPTSPGFGIRVISASIERQLDGRVEFDWRPDGLRCTLTVPCSDKIEAQRPTFVYPLAAADKSHLPLRLARGNRLLLVEDEILVAMMMRDILTEIGFTVVGPFSRLSEAMVAAVHEEIDAGMIDVNLGGEFAYPVADVLMARRIPFVFVTGYGVESIDPRFRHVAIVKKPVQRQVLQKIFVIAEGDAAAQFPRHGVARTRAELRRVADA